MIRWTVVIFLVSGYSGWSADDAKMLPKDRAADGWLMVFDGATTFGWNCLGTVMVEGESLVIGGNDASSATLATTFGAGQLSIEYMIEKGPPGSLVLNGEIVATADANDTNVWKSFEHAFSDGPIQLGLSVPAGGKTKVRNVQFKPDTDKLLFNGKDLTGWKPIPGRKSVFTVTPAGELNIKNGNGDLQTIDEWDDFVLQLDIISHGKHLNSGVFYRAIPGEFWSGYEAQIRNQWEGDNRKKPIDFGTGGIYNRQKSRMVVSNDNEWFTMTVVAVGNQHSVWVNGYQTASFLDTKPMAKSARQGRKDTKGCITLQGHDPTTDLSFRNIKLQVIPKKTG